MGTRRAWMDLARDTVDSFDSRDIADLYTVEWAEARDVLVSEHRDALEKERRGWRRELLRASALLHGLVRRLSPARRLVVLFVLLGLFFSVLKLVTRGWPGDASGTVFSLLLCTVLLLLLLGPDGSFTAAIAGHPPVLRVDGAGRVVERFGRGAYPLGMKLSQSYGVEAGALGAGESLLIHSDGLPEARDEAEREFGDARVLSVLARTAGRTAAEIASALSGEVLSFLGRRPVGDDVSIAVIRRTPT